MRLRVRLRDFVPLALQHRRLGTLSAASPFSGRVALRARMTELALVFAIGTVLGAAGGCAGDNGDASSPQAKSPVLPLCTSRDPGPSPLRRLTRAEYARTISDLLGPGVVDAATLPPDEQALGFDNNADVLGTSELLVASHLDLAVEAGQKIALDLQRFAPCAGADTDAVCGTRFVAEFGRRAWRRALTGDETAELGAVLAQGQTEGGLAEGIARVAAAILGSPQFLYRLERGSTAAPELPGAVALAPHELATRLSYLLWRSAPDAALLATADGGGLVTRADLEREARRMLGDPRAREAVAAFHAAWLGLDRLADLDKDRVIYPTFNPGLGDRFRRETLAFVDEVVWRREGTLAALLTAPYTAADAMLASFYGAAAPVPAGTAADGFGLITLDRSRRAGLLTQGSFLAVHAKANQSSPVHRGRFVREQLFCTTPPPPPANVEIRAPALDPRRTTRERFDEHVASAACRTCHVLLDPIGFGFEHFDGIGRWRDTEGGKPVDATGELVGTDVDGPFDGPVALAAKLAISGQVQSCYVTQWFRFAYGRAETAADACTLADLMTTFAATNGSVRELLVAITQTDAFRFRRAEDTP